MPKVKVYNQKGAAAGELQLKKEVFGAEYKPALIHQVVVAQQNNLRQGTKSTLTRAQVRGGGRKPWRQKGTGNARHGSIRNPQWKGGGVVFAPKPRDFSQKVNKKAKRVAIKSALSRKVELGNFIVLDEIKLKEAKTKQMVKVLENLKLAKSVLIVTDVNDASVVRATSNIPKTNTITAELINVLDLVKFTHLVITKAAVAKLEEMFTDQPVEKVATKVAK
ncbi:MAG: 50S ribosomal protein L4 [Firmicutes bacterium]|nr:50S ribosomal protein L4 [Bacillota bacterium]